MRAGASSCMEMAYHARVSVSTIFVCIPTRSRVSCSTMKTVEIVHTNHPGDPPLGSRLFVLDVEPDAVIVDWNGKRWPMLPEHVRVAS